MDSSLIQDEMYMGLILNKSCENNLELQWVHECSSYIMPRRNLFAVHHPHPLALIFFPLPHWFPMDSFLIDSPFTEHLLYTAHRAKLFTCLALLHPHSHPTKDHPHVEEEEMGVSDWLEHFQEIGPVFNSQTNLRGTHRAETSSQLTGRRRGVGQESHLAEWLYLSL